MDEGREALPDGHRRRQQQSPVEAKLAI